jgi:hypothetical protein
MPKSIGIGRQYSYRNMNISLRMLTCPCQCKYYQGKAKEDVLMHSNVQPTIYGLRGDFPPPAATGGMIFALGLAKGITTPKLPHLCPICEMPGASALVRCDLCDIFVGSCCSETLCGPMKNERWCHNCLTAAGY